MTDSNQHSEPLGVIGYTTREFELSAPCRCDKCRDCVAANGYERLQEQLETTRTALRYIEWVYDGEDDRCPSCGMTKAQGHDWSCRTAKALGVSIPASESERP